MALWASAIFLLLAVIEIALCKRSYCMFYRWPAQCNGHFGVAGGDIVAGVMAAELRRRGFVK